MAARLPLASSGSRKSAKAGSVRSLAQQSSSDPDETHSAFQCPVPTSAWRKILKDLIAYYREIQTHYELKSKSLLKLANVANNISTPASFLGLGGIDDALQILRVYHNSAILESNKARDIEEDVILALTGLRSDLHHKIKEIKNLSGDFKNSVDKEMDSTRKVVQVLQDTLVQSDLDASSTIGKQDPYLLRLAVDRQNSGRELEAIVVGEVQKAYNAYAGILKRESDAAYGTIDEIRIGPISMPKDHEWLFFVQKDKQFVDSGTPIRAAEHIQYPGRDHAACQEIRGGLLERKSKYLKSYTAGWYVLSSTHLHEFKSADKGQAPVMSLYLPEQKLGSHSTEGGSSNKFTLKGRQTGSMHRGHSWVFRAESHDTMMAWYDDIKVLTERTAQERTDAARGHLRSLSQSSNRSTSSDGVLDDDDDEPYSADTAVAVITNSKQDFRRPEAV
ncbi:Phosphatidylinositol 4,5-bisphosphate-binding protein SLM1 [Colletotrichum orbiculare MAFF 240422]|uniref:Phosphatidylinositol 4,5-bisphosphate-binding protein SLM1 n=1 Tax=Colletotrichum orbiculare (strain 104-T / ATCC 96160 / CBS 514.97 / LARS 414 / MAFF 240422) TaxID=1213857 RepID=A0A484G408_COLOR|nr:Phosphatidylinositol 4,5-bisphosphate-binding protein SLM1 [Colletotrichum orbiculare MAFF 240422]